MMGKRQQRAPKLFYTGLDLDDRVPEGHRLRAIRRALSFERVRPMVASHYGRNGHASLDPVVVLKLMLLLFIEGVASERELMRQLPCRLDWLWFLEMDLDDPVPDHSVLSKARQRWGVDVFEALFAEVLCECIAGGLVDGATVYADSTVLKADASVESRVARKLWEQLERSSNPGDCDDPDASGGASTPPEDTQAHDLPPAPTGRFNAMTVSTTDPDAATTRRRGRGVTLGYRDHCLVDDRRGVVLATIATPANYDDSGPLTRLLDKQARYTGVTPKRVAADSAYGTRANVSALRERGIKPYLKKRPGKIGSRRRGHWLDQMPSECTPWSCRRYMNRRLAVAEGRFAQAHTRMDHRRCRWRRRWRVQIQCYLVAMAQNLLKLARYGRGPQSHAPAAVIGKMSAGLFRWATNTSLAQTKRQPA